MEQKILKKVILVLSIILVITFGYYIFTIATDSLVNVEKIEIKNTDLELKYGDKVVIDAEVLPKNATNKNITWVSSNPNLVTVHSDGTITVNKNEDGEAIIQAISRQNNVSSSVKIKVRKIDYIVDVNEIILDKTAVNLNYNESLEVKATISPTNATNKNIIWSSSDTSLVTVDNNGTIKAISNRSGTVIITAVTADGNKSATVVVNVKKIDEVVKVTGVKLSKTKVTLNYNQSTTLKATISPTNATNKNIIWSSSDTSLVTVDSSGNIKAIGNKNGTVTVTATSVESKYKASAEVTVKAVPTSVKVTGVKINQGTGTTIYLNKKNNISISLKATISPTNATNKGITWSSDNSNVASVDSNGKVIANGLGVANIKVTTNDGKYTATYKLTVKQKAIVVITASAGGRMDKWFTTYTSSKNNYYSKSAGTLKYVYKGGSGFDFQYGEGLTQAKTYINQKYGNKKNYVELSVFFTLTGNSVNKFTCDQVNTSDEYLNIASEYNNAVKQIKNLGYTNTKGYVISHSPLNTKHPLAKSKNIVYSHKEEACKSGYRSAWKYWLSNKRMKSVIATGKYSNLKFIDNFSNFVVINDESKRTFTWLRAFSTPEDDPLHWDEPTTISYMQLAFDTAGM